MKIGLSLATSWPEYLMNMKLQYASSLLEKLIKQIVLISRNSKLLSAISKYITWLPGICLHSLINLASHNKGISQNFISFYFGSTLVLILGGNRLVTEKGSSYWLMNVIVFISLLWLSWWRWYQTNEKCDVGLII